MLIDGTNYFWDFKNLVPIFLMGQWITISEGQITFLESRTLCSESRWNPWNLCQNHGDSAWNHGITYTFSTSDPPLDHIPPGTPREMIYFQ